jgi:hypothetical protein
MFEIPKDINFLIYDFLSIPELLKIKTVSKRYGNSLENYIKIRKLPIGEFKKVFLKGKLENVSLVGAAMIVNSKYFLEHVHKYTNAITTNNKKFNCIDISYSVRFGHCKVLIWYILNYEKIDKKNNFIFSRKSFFLILIRHDLKPVLEILINKYPIIKEYYDCVKKYDYDELKKIANELYVLFLCNF